MQRDGESPDGRAPDGSEPEVEVQTPGPDSPNAGGFFRDTLNQGPVPPPRKREGFFRPAKQDGPVLITEAAPSLEQQHKDRVRRYSILMGFRIPCLVLAALAYGQWHNALISLAIIGVSIPLPWIAVLVANDRPPRRKDEPSRWDGRRAEHKALESGRNRSIDG